MDLGYLGVTLYNNPKRYPLFTLEKAMARRLTAAAVARLRPGKQRREVRDASAEGLYLIIQPSGVRSWALRFRRPDGRPTKLTLGGLNLSGKPTNGEPQLGAPLTLSEARWMAAEVHRRRAAGRDVVADYAAEKQRQRVAIRERSANTFGAAARDFVAEHARRKTRRWRDTAKLLGLSYPADDGSEPIKAKGGLAARWADKPVADIDGHDIHAVIDEARRHGVPGMNRRTEGISDARGRLLARALSKMFSWLVAHRRIGSNPCDGVHVPPASAARDRVLTEQEIRWLWAACDTIGEPFGPLTKMLLLTGARLREVAQMTCGELSEDRATWSLPGSRTKNGRPHVVPLQPLAHDIITSMRQIAGKPGYVFSTNGTTPVSGFSKMKARLDCAMLATAQETAASAGCDPRDVAITPWRLHDLRRTCATGMAEIGVAPHVIELTLNNVSGVRAGVAGIYNRSELLPERKTAMERWAVHVEGLVFGKTEKVVELRRREP